MEIPKSAKNHITPFFSQDIVLASNNRHKLLEIQALAKKWGIKILSLKNFPSLPEIIEDGSTFYENALKKATVVANFTGKITIADDSGLEVEFLGDRPGVHSARYAGENADDKKNNLKLLEELKEAPREKRGALFKCAIVIADPWGKNDFAEGECRGTIGFEPKGEHGFGYDPLFFLPDYGKTFAEMALEVKNRISHRARAAARAMELIKQSTH